MLRRFRHLVGLDSTKNNGSVRGKVDADPGSVSGEGVSPAMFETVQEIAVYVHRFHNLDLFQQGWYQIKITMNWEDGDGSATGTPARVVQYEVPDVGPDDVLTIWRINDADNSFSTQPFRIKYARQDVLLSVMIAFNLSLDQDDRFLACAAILKFELLYAPLMENVSGLHVSLDAFPASVHELRVPPRALLGVHSYCPIHFDAFHMVLVDLSIHIVLLKAGNFIISQSEPSVSGDVSATSCIKQASGPSKVVAEKEIAYVKALLDSRDILLEELQKLSKALDQRIDELVDAIQTGASHAQGDSSTKATDSSQEKSVLGRASSQSERNQSVVGFRSQWNMIHSMSSEELFAAFNMLGDQLLVLWNAFLKFHRVNRAKILEYLRDIWSTNQKTEWLIWMVHSTLEGPNGSIRNGIDGSPYAVLGKISSSKKSSDDPVQNAISRAELHRKSISHMKINNRAIQDLCIYGDPSRVPIVVVERHRIRGLEQSNALSHSDHKDEPFKWSGTRSMNKPSTGRQRKNGRQLSFVVFVHGFQGHHQDLRNIRNIWLLIDPGAECLMSESNEEKTSGDFREMGARLAKEVSAFVKRKMETRSGTYKSIKLSFVGHSIGNIIIRTAIAEAAMEPFLKYLHTYMSVSGPHLGYLYSSNSLFNSGLWVLKKFKGAHCIHQLTFSDDPDMQNTFLYRLSKQKTLDNFKNIILLSSPQDGYVPYHSARIEYCRAAASDSKKGPIFSDMLHSCLDQIHAPSLHPRTLIRCDVNFDTSSQTRSLNTIIGRAAHIEFLETDIFARFIMWSFSDLFI